MAKYSPTPKRGTVTTRNPEQQNLTAHVTKAPPPPPKPAPRIHPQRRKALPRRGDAATLTNCENTS